ncbi:hypothetical protein MAR_026110, partial [Mya arenaria]
MKVDRVSHERTQLATLAAVLMLVGEFGGEGLGGPNTFLPDTTLSSFFTENASFGVGAFCLRNDGTFLSEEEFPNP